MLSAGVITVSNVSMALADEVTIMPSGTVGGVNISEKIQKGTIEFSDLPIFLAQILKFCLSIAGAVAVLMVVIAGYYLALGSSDSKSKGKTIITYAIMGLAVIAFSWFIIDGFVNLVTS